MSKERGEQRDRQGKRRARKETSEERDRRGKIRARKETGEGRGGRGKRQARKEMGEGEIGKRGAGRDRRGKRGGTTSFTSRSMARSLLVPPVPLPLVKSPP